MPLGLAVLTAVLTVTVLTGIFGYLIEKGEEHDEGEDKQDVSANYESTAKVDKR